MASADWTEVAGVLITGDVARGTTSAIPTAPGAGAYCFGWRGLGVYTGAVAAYVNATDFGPMVKGGSIRGLIQRAAAGSQRGHSPFLFIAADAANVSGNAYLLGLTDEAQPRIALAKARLVDGLAGVAVGVAGILAKSVEPIPAGVWAHLRLDVVKQVSGDVLLQVRQNNTGLHPIGTPAAWTPVAGIDDITDDALGVTTGSAPLVGGYAGMGMTLYGVGNDCRAFVDNIELFRQT